MIMGIDKKYLIAVAVVAAAMVYASNNVGVVKKAIG